mmetsp:Transcript_23727/g.68257  ORF Transcript_23727/g.68257 Transcript_23727/m.68257 type:complete len:80 (-) Transcript_23727:656-895(-)
MALNSHCVAVSCPSCTLPKTDHDACSNMSNELCVGGETIGCSAMHLWCVVHECRMLDKQRSLRERAGHGVGTIHLFHSI